MPAQIQISNQVRDVVRFAAQFGFGNHKIAAAIGISGNTICHHLQPELSAGRAKRAELNRVSRSIDEVIDKIASSTRTCSSCGTGFRCFSYGRPRKFCEACRPPTYQPIGHASSAVISTDKPLRLRACMQCGSANSRSAHSKYCSHKCKCLAFNEVSRDRYVSVALCGPVQCFRYECVQCSTEFFSPSLHRKFCSLKCNSKWRFQSGRDRERRARYKSSPYALALVRRRYWVDHVATLCQMRTRLKRRIDQITDGYVAELMHFPLKALPQELIELKRQHLRLLRLIREKTT